MNYDKNQSGILSLYDFGVGLKNYNPLIKINAKEK